MIKTPKDPLRYVKGIGPARAKVFQKLGIFSIEDLLYYFPRRYEDRTNFTAVASLRDKQTAAIKVKVLRIDNRRSWHGRGFNILKVKVADKTGTFFSVWFNQPYLVNYFKLGEELILYGRVEQYEGKLQMSSPEFEVVSSEHDNSLSAGRIVPVYTLPAGVTQRYFRRLVSLVLDEYLGHLKDFLPYDIRSRLNLFNLPRSLRLIHFPEDFPSQKEAYQRLSFEEFFLFQIPLILRKLKKKEKRGISHQVEAGLAQDFIAALPFKLTSAQEKVIAEIKADMASPLVMQRLLQGDVGSGKTVVATIAALIAVQGGYQAAFMAPTEILARQHYEKISSQFMVRSSGLRKIKVGLLTSSLPVKEKNKLCQQIKEGKIDLVIGTHALLEERVSFKNLGLVVIDEQHKFGVSQRTLLPKKGPNPDTLIMTATPIPRTLAITLYGDLDISVINELPPGRLAIKTVHFGEDAVTSAYELAKEHLLRGSQVYIVYPVIEESYALDMEGAKKMYEELKETEFREFSVGLIHGRMKQKEQDAVMSKFRNKELDVLVSTTVLEVGIDIPNATCMLIEYAERFGLAQLHQLRGRVGRGGMDSVCVLISDASSVEAKARLGAMLKYNDGFRISEEDLKIRGPGEFFGDRQHGLAELRIANPLTQMQLLKRSREEAIKLLRLDPRLEAQQNILLKEKLLERFPAYKNYEMAT